MSSQRRNLYLWISVLTGPILWLISFAAKFFWVPVACATQTKLVLLLFSVVALLMTVAAGLMGWQQFQQLGRSTVADSGDPLARSRFFAIGGMALSAGFCLVLIAQTLPDLVLGVCQ